MLKVGENPMLENLIDSFIEQGFYRFCISTFFKPDVIKDYFNDGSKKGIEISDLDEKSPLGTGGCLNLISPNLSRGLPIIVINGDILTNLKFNAILDYHVLNNANATMAIKGVIDNIPFGVVSFSESEFVKIEEKPAREYFINCGIYVVNPDATKLIPQNSKITMPDVFQILKEDNKNVLVFPVHEYWLDIGNPEDFEKAQIEFESFK